MFQISDLCNMLENYLEPEQVKDIHHAYLFGAEAHEGQQRISGEPYIHHPLAVARILAEMRMDYATIAAAILHDVIEDTNIHKEQLAEMFSEEIAELVDGVSKLTHIKFETKAEAQAENFRKMLLAMTKDIRVILIKLADRLHNMRTLKVLSPDKRRSITHETLEIYVPIANRLGLNAICLEMQDLGLAARYPLRHRILEKELSEFIGTHRDTVTKIQKTIEIRLAKENLSGDVIGRKKHLYSIYEKMRSKHLNFKAVTDVYGFRIIVDAVDACYRALGTVHSLYKPIPGKFKDYIAIPKSNGYQSLHTTLRGPHGFPIEVQIRTYLMDNVAEAGIAAHWQYKDGNEGKSIASIGVREWLTHLLDMQKRAGNSREFLEHVKIDLFPDEIYVFTPNGKIMGLPSGACAVDFAYAVHTDVGHRCVNAKVDHSLAPLHTKLISGQSVEILTAPHSHPNPAWLDFVVTAKARVNIRSYLKNLRHDQSVALGYRLLKNALRDASLEIDSLPEEQIKQLLERYNLPSLDALLAEIGLGNRIAALVAAALYTSDGSQVEITDKKVDSPLSITGAEGLVVNYGKCCYPIPGDPIVGYLSAGRGIVIHTQSCTTSKGRNLGESIPIRWEKNTKIDFPVALHIDVPNRRGVLAGVAEVIAERDANIKTVVIEERDSSQSVIEMTISVRNRHHLATIMRRLRDLGSVSRLSRNRASNERRKGNGHGH